MALHPCKGEPLYLVIEDSKTAKRGTHMDALAKMKDPVTEGYLQGHQYVCAIVRFLDQVIPYGGRLYVKQEHCPALDLAFRKTTEMAAQLMHAFEAPADVKVMVLFDAYYLCRGWSRLVASATFVLPPHSRTLGVSLKRVGSSKLGAMAGTGVGDVPPRRSRLRSRMGRPATDSSTLAGLR